MPMGSGPRTYCGASCVSDIVTIVRRLVVVSAASSSSYVSFLVGSRLSLYGTPGAAETTRRRSESWLPC